MADLPRALVICAAALLMENCRQDMHDQPRYEPLQKSDFFADGRSARPLVAGTVARGHLVANNALNTGSESGHFTDSFPLPVTRQVIERGHERFDIYCSPCHGRTGDGRGMVSRRGFRAPPSLHDERSRALPAGYIFSVITNGYGAMPAYVDQIPRDDRWSIVSYLRVLQYSHTVPITGIPAAERNRIGETAEVR